MFAHFILKMTWKFLMQKNFFPSNVDMLFILMNKNQNIFLVYNISVTFQCFQLLSEKWMAEHLEWNQCAGVCIFWKQNNTPLCLVRQSSWRIFDEFISTFELVLKLFFRIVNSSLVENFWWTFIGLITSSLIANLILK